MILRHKVRALEATTKLIVSYILSARLLREPVFCFPNKRGQRLRERFFSRNLEPSLFGQQNIGSLKSLADNI